MRNLARPYAFILPSLVALGCADGTSPTQPTPQPPKTAPPSTTVKPPFFTTYGSAAGSWQFAEGGGRLLVSGTARGVLHWADTAWVADPDTRDLGNSTDALWVDEAGHAWATTRVACSVDGSGGTCPEVWHSPAPGAPWIKAPALPNAVAAAFAARVIWMGGGGPSRAPVLITAERQSTNGGYDALYYPVVLRWNGNGWSDQGYPAARGAGLSTDVPLIAVSSAGDLVTGERVADASASTGMGTPYRTNVGRYAAGVWTFADVPVASGTCRGQPRALRAAPGGVVYAVATECANGGSELLAISDAGVRSIANPFTERGTPYSLLAVGPGGRLALASDRSVIWQKTAGSWADYGEYTLPASFAVQYSIWWASDGVLWMSLLAGDPASGTAFPDVGALHITLP